MMIRDFYRRFANEHMRAGRRAIAAGDMARAKIHLDASQNWVTRYRNQLIADGVKL